MNDPTHPGDFPRASSGCRAGPGQDPGSGSGRAPHGRAAVRIQPLVGLRSHAADGSRPLQSFIELEAVAHAVPCARLHARRQLGEWGLRQLGDSAELVVTELVTNAVKASQGVAGASPVRLWLESGSSQILIIVWDASRQAPARTDGMVDAEDGRGLILVEALSHRWGWLISDNYSGKVVWAIVR